MAEIELTGLDGKNPIAFLAALGTLDALASAGRASGEEPKLRWRAKGQYVPVLHAALDREALLDVLVRDAASFVGEPALELRYAKDGTGPTAHDLKPPPREFREYLMRLRTTGRRSLEFAAAFATGVGTDNKGNTKPTALHFSAGQQEFLAMVTDLRDGITREDLQEALFGPWRYARALPVLQWDNASSRDYALRASDPSKDKKLGVPGADWLAFRGMRFIRVVPNGTRTVTTGCRGGWKTGSFSWPIWTVPLTVPVVTGVLASSLSVECDATELGARGIEVVLEASIRRSDQGGYGSFAPASVRAIATRTL